MSSIPEYCRDCVRARQVNLPSSTRPVQCDRCTNGSHFEPDSNKSDANEFAKVLADSEESAESNSMASKLIVQLRMRSGDLETRADELRKKAIELEEEAEKCRKSADDLAFLFPDSLSVHD